MGKITEALKKVSDERLARIQKKPEIQYVVRKEKDSRIDEHIAAFHDSTSPVAEQYRIVRTNLQTLKATKNYKTFVLTSSISKEGKTVTALNLAIALAQDLDHKSVLLIDADMRKGRVAHYLGLKRSPGLSEVLRDSAQPEAVLVSPNIDNLTVLPAGKAPRNPSELLGSKKMQQLIAAFQARFDYIFIDTPPVTTVTDACLLGAMADGVILIIQAGRTQRDAVLHAQSLLHQAHAKPLGYIMTNVEYHLPHYLYRYVHTYGDYQYYEKGERGGEEEVSCECAAK